MLLPVLLALPWVGFALYLVLRVRLPPELPEPLPPGAPAPLVSVIVPARDEALNIERVLASMAASEYPAFEILVVDDRSGDGTAELARAVDPGRASRLEVIEGKPLPEGWLGKPWACWQGYLAARGDVLLFTDADTVHGPRLLGRAVAALEEDGDAGALTLVGRQLTGTFWEHLVQPQVFITLVARFPRPTRRLPPHRWRDAIANGQYMLFRREAYERLEGHRQVRDEVVEDMRFAQLLVEQGMRLLVRRAEDDLATRMYRSLEGLVSGWSKNLVPGSLLTFPPWLAPMIPPAMLVAVVLLWLVPPLVLAGAAAGLLGAAALAWSSGVVAFSALFWCAVTARFGAPWLYGVLYPLGAAVQAWIVLRSWTGKGRVEWKGRSYRVGGGGAYRE